MAGKRKAASAAKAAAPKIKEEENNEPANAPQLTEYEMQRLAMYVCLLCDRHSRLTTSFFKLD